MKKSVHLRLRFFMVASLGLLMACGSTRNNNDATQAPASDDLLELLTGFGESISKRNYIKAVDYMVPEEKAMMMEGGIVPESKQKMLLALPLQRLIRHPGIRAENGHIAGVYAILPNLQQGEAMPVSAPEGTPDGDLVMDDATAPTGSELTQESEGAEPMPTLAQDAQSTDSEEEVAQETPASDPQLKLTINKFFSAVNKKNWSMALALMNDEEKKFFYDDKGRLKESSKQRLSQMDQKSSDVLQLQDGKLSGVTLLLPAN